MPTSYLFYPQARKQIKTKTEFLLLKTIITKTTDKSQTNHRRVQKIRDYSQSSHRRLQTSHRRLTDNYRRVTDDYIRITPNVFLNPFMKQYF